MPLRRLDAGKNKPLKWTGLVRRIENPIQSKWIWTGLDYKIACSTDSGLDWIGNLPFPYFILEDKSLLPYKTQRFGGFLAAKSTEIFMKEVRK